MFRRLGLVFAALAIFTIAGGHWALLQTVAWAEMLRDYSQRSGSVAVAVGQTFDGQHPCELCRKIQAAKTNEHRQNPAVPDARELGKLKALLPDSIQPRRTFTVTAVSVARDPSPFGAGRTDSPPTPPPRQQNSAA